MFSFSDKKTESVDEHAANVGAADVQPGGGSVASSTANAARQAATSAAAASPRKRGRSSSDARTSADDNRALRERIDQEIQRQLDYLHEPKQWAALLSMPADAARVITGADRWKLASEERETLGLTGSAFARTMMITNPRALATMMLASALMATYMPRAVEQLKEMREKKEKEKKDAPKAAT